MFVGMKYAEVITTFFFLKKIVIKLYELELASSMPTALNSSSSEYDYTLSSESAW